MSWHNIFVMLAAVDGNQTSLRAGHITRKLCWFAKFHYRLYICIRYTWGGQQSSSCGYLKVNLNRILLNIYIFVVLLLASAFLVVKLDKGTRREHLHWVSVAFAVSGGRSLFGTASETRWKWATYSVSWLWSTRYWLAIDLGRSEYIRIISWWSFKGGRLIASLLI